MSVRLLLAFLAAALLTTGLAHASLVTFTFTGLIDNDPFGLFNSAAFDGTYTFDSNIPQILDTPNSGGYADTGGSTSMTVSFTGADPSVTGPYLADTLNITVNNDFLGPLDEYLVTGSSSTNTSFCFPLCIEIRLQDFTGTAFSNTSLPLSAPNLADFTTLAFAIFAGTLDSPVEAEGVLTSLQCTAGCGAIRGVPEPDAILLLAVALGALAVARRRAVAR